MPLRKTITTLFVAALMFSQSGCASIVSGGAKTLPIMSTPDGAELEVKNLRSGETILKAKTPFTALLERSSGFFQSAKYEVRINKEGYLPHQTVIEAGINGWYFGNIIFGGLVGLLIVDPATGAMWRINEESVMAKLYPDTTQGRADFQKDEEIRIAAEKAAEAVLKAGPR
ncbi:MAG TPA: hypothetical protein HPP94_11345 [Desulfuromonadales bacterium]|nr:hypothetical protein [Desulfuromonadales bacterium]